jgi:hypothetical protein
MKAGLDSVEMIQNQCLEILLPDCEVRSLAFKNNIVSIFPNTPGTNQKDLREEREHKNRFGLQDLLVNA